MKVVLAADPDPWTRDLIAERLTFPYFIVLEADSLEMALRTINNYKVDLILSRISGIPDVEIPRQDYTSERELVKLFSPN